MTQYRAGYQPELDKVPDANVPSTPQPVQAPGYTPGMATSTGYQAAPYKVEPQGLVQNQVRDIVAKDSPLMQQAERISNQRMNERGLVNSSMAIGAGREAVIAQALPIAQADAATYDRAMTNTANQENAARQFGAAAENNVRLSNQAATNEMLKGQQQGTIALTNAKMTQDAQIALGNLDANTKIALTTMDNRTRSLLQTNQSASNAYVQTITNINAIQNNKEMGEAAKKAAIDNQLALLREQMESLSSQDWTAKQTLAYPQELTELNLGRYFQPIFKTNGAPPGATSASPGPAGVTPSTQPAAGTKPYTGDVSVNPEAGGIVMQGTGLPGKLPSRRLVPSGGPPPWPGAIKRGTTVEGGNGRQVFDVYY